MLCPRLGANHCHNYNVNIIPRFNKNVPSNLRSFLGTFTAVARELFDN